MFDCSTCDGSGLTCVHGSSVSIFTPCKACQGDGCAREEPYRPWDWTDPAPAAAGQTRTKSLIETITSTAIGFAVSMVLVSVVMPAFGYPTTLAHDFWITCIFTVASVLRGYGVRRLFNR